MSGILKWYEINGPEDNVCIASKVRLFRNLSAFPFPYAANEEERNNILHLVLEAAKNLDSLGLSMELLMLEEISDIRRLQLVERKLASPDFLRHNSGRALLISRDERLVIAIGGEDHIAIQVLEAGLQPQAALALAMAVEEVLDEHLTFAFDPELGYLTANPANLGTAMLSEVLLHLCGMDELGLLTRLSSVLSKMGMMLSHTKSGPHEYLLTNQVTMGITENQATQNLADITAQIIEQELAAQSAAIPVRADFEDRLMRTLGQLKFTTKIPYEELLVAVSLFRVGVCQKIINLRPYLLHTLTLLTGPAGIMAESGCKAEEIDGLRAKAVQSALQELL